MYFTIYENVKQSRGYNTLSANQKEIHNYILGNIDKISSLTVEKIADSCFCSPTSVNRYCKKMGAEGYNQLRHSLIYCQSRENNSYIELEDKIGASIKDINLDKLEQFCDHIKNGSIIYIFGTGTSYLMGMYLQRLLNRVGIVAIASNEVHFIRNLSQINTCIILSNTGETYSSIQVANELKEYAKILSLTKEKSRLDKLSDISLTHNNNLNVDDSIENELNINISIMIVALMEKLK